MSKQRLIAVIGAGGGIGSALVRRLIARDAKLVLIGRSKDKLESLNTDGDIHTIDASDRKQLSSVLESVAKQNDGRIDGVVNLAGSILLKPAHRTTAEEFDETVNTNLRTAFNTVAVSAPLMRRKNGGAGGAIVLMSTCAARIGLANHEAIAASKAGIEGLTRSAAATYAPWGVRINAIAPGLVDTPLSASLMSNEAAKKASLAMHPLGRLGEPDDVASAIDFVLFHTWMTGQTIGVDGGISVTR